MKSFQHLFTKYLTEQPAPAAPPKPDVKPDVKPDTKPGTIPTREPGKPTRRYPFQPRPGIQPKPKGTKFKNEEEEKKVKNPYAKYFLQYRKNIGRK